MVPFLDPGSRFFEEPEKHGYRIFHRTLNEHRAAMVEPLWHRRLNYETQWLSRREIQDVSYDAVSQLVAIKSELGILPPHFAKTVQRKIEETKTLLTEAERALELDARFPSGLRDTIRAYNRQILSYSSDQIIPMERPFGGRWFDDFTVPIEIIEACKRPMA
jgi:clorobiocin biosynthesis protein CloN6